MVPASLISHVVSESAMFILLMLTLQACREGRWNGARGRRAHAAELERIAGPREKKDGPRSHARTAMRVTVRRARAARTTARRGPGMQSTDGSDSGCMAGISAKRACKSVRTTV